MTLRSVKEPAETDLTVYIGDTFDHEFTWTHDGEAVPLAGWTGTAQGRKSAAAVDVLVTFTVVVRDAPTGKFALTLTAAQTALLAPAYGVWDVQLVHSDGRKVTPGKGALLIVRDVTR